MCIEFDIGLTLWDTYVERHSPVHPVHRVPERGKGEVERIRLVNYVYLMMDCIYILVNLTCNDSLYNALVLVVRFELYMFWSDLNYICIYIYVLVEFEL